jgi:imidazolonepropionase-like amidohydrolase
MIIAHAVQYASFGRALEGKVDIITHVPLDKTLDKSVIDAMVSQQVVAVPTLSMMEKVYTNLKRPGIDYANARDGVAAMHKAGVTILAGTDANNAPGSPAKVKHGESLHHELELLVEAGLSNLDVLRAATVGPAKYFGLSDRGTIEVGKSADLVLIQGNPLEDIKNTTNIQRVWCNGIEVKRD